MLGLRTRIRLDIDASPAEVLFGSSLRLPGEFFSDQNAENDRQFFTKELRQFMRNVRPIPATTHSNFKPFVHKKLGGCSHVFVRTTPTKIALEPPYLGPFKVQARPSPYFYVIRALNKKGVEELKTVSTSRIKPAHGTRADIDNCRPEISEPDYQAEESILVDNFDDEFNDNYNVVLAPDVPYATASQKTTKKCKPRNTTTKSILKPKSSMSTQDANKKEKKHVAAAKKRTYPENIFISETICEAPLQELLLHTAARLLLALKITPATPTNVKLVCKYGFDGTNAKSYKQKAVDPDAFCQSIFCSSVLPLQLVDETTGEVYWKNPRPSSTRYCRPIKVSYEKETTTTINREANELKEKINKLEKLTYENWSVSFQMHLTMIDGKVCNALTKTSSQTCFVCGTTISHLNDIEECCNEPIKIDSLNYGFSVFHAHIRFMELVLYISYRMKWKVWRVEGAKLKCKVKAKNKLIQERLRTALGTTVDVPTHGYGNTNDGNTARKFFSNVQIVSEITAFNVKLLNRLKVILAVISSQKKINSKKFKKYCLDTALMYEKLYWWYYMPPSMHVILIHGHQIMDHLILPIGMLSEEAQECNNKNFKKFRENHSRKINGKPQNVVNPSGDSYRVKAPVVAGSLSDSEEGTIGERLLTLQYLKNSKTVEGLQQLEVPENSGNNRRGSVSSNASSASGLSTNIYKRKKTILDVGDPGPEQTLYSKAEDELLDIIHIFELRAKKKSCAERLDEVSEKLQSIRKLLLGLALENANLRGRLAATKYDSTKKVTSYAEATKRMKSRLKDPLAQRTPRPSPKPKTVGRPNEELTGPEARFEPKFRLGPKGTSTVHWVLEVTPEFRNKVTKMKGLFLGWQRCRIRDFRRLSRCYKC
uniref:Uncharacterized protein n=1 Tax=Trichogramma kaykai TaxID=54128 RepID=A0ABD2W5E4_9HYME